MKFTRTEAVTLPKWTKALRFVPNGIDGWPPQMPEVLTVEEFLRNADELQRHDGAGEWDVLVYAVDQPEIAPRVVYPCGRDNPYRKLRTDRGFRVKLVATFDYMRWAYIEFTTA